MERVGWIDTAKGLGIFFVVYGHVLVGLNASPIQLPNIFFRHSFDFIWSFHMHLFFFLAGILAIGSLESKKWSSFIANKIRVLAYPYFLWSTIQGVIQTLLSNYTNSNVSFVDVLKILYCPLPNQHFWFLYVLFVFFVVVTIVKFSRYNIFILFLLSLIIFIYPHDFESRILQKSKLFFIFFMTGVCISTFNLRYIINYLKNNINSYIIFFITAAYIIFFNSVYNNCSFFLKNIIFSMIGIFVVIFFSVFLNKILDYNFFSIIGKYSLPIYLMHSIFLATPRIILYNFLDFDNFIIHIFLGLFFGLIIPFYIARFIHNSNIKYLFTLN